MQDLKFHAMADETGIRPTLPVRWANISVVAARAGRG